MKSPSPKPALLALLAAKNARQKNPVPVETSNSVNAVLNVQNRRVLAQHYRAKYGVK